MCGELVLVTGASGYIAAHIVQQLLQLDYRVRGTVRNLNNAAKIDSLRQLCPDSLYPLELVEADLLDAESWKAAVHGCRYVIHVASPVVLKEPEHEDDVIKAAVLGKASDFVISGIIISFISRNVNRKYTAPSP